MLKNITMFSAEVRKLASFLWSGALIYFAYLMLLITIQYVPANLDVAFLRVKQEVIGLFHYQFAFFAHVYSSMLVLLCGMVQFSAYRRKRFATIHRISGRLYVALILFVSGPSGLVMGFYGNGGWIGKSAFCLLAIIWMYFTYTGFRAATLHNLIEHKKWMLRSYALTLSAISLRFWKFFLVFLFDPRPMDVYQLVAWLGWIGNLLIAELIIYHTMKSFKRAPADVSIS